MPFIPHNEADIREMLDAIGVDDIARLFDEIPGSLLCQSGCDSYQDDYEEKV